MAKLMLRDNGMINPDNYIGIPDEMGNIKYYREDLFDDLPDQEFNALMMNATPYDMLGDLADNHKRRFQRRQFKLDRKEAKRQAKAERQAQRQQARADRQAQRQASKEARQMTRQLEKSQRAQTRGENIGGIVESAGAVLGGLVEGDQTGATVNFGTGQGVQVDGTIGVGAQKNFLTDSSIVPGVPNYILLAGAGLGAFLLLKK
jgi:hypothetical protein